MNTCTIAEAKCVAAQVTEHIDNASRLRLMVTAARDKLRASWSDHDKGTDPWDVRRACIELEVATLQAEFNTELSKARVLLNKVERGEIEG